MAEEDRSQTFKSEDAIDYAFTDEVIEVHGNGAFMRCFDFCDKKWYKIPTREEVKANGIPKCRECGNLMKPHKMLFDERYSEEFYRS